MGTLLVEYFLSLFDAIRNIPTKNQQQPLWYLSIKSTLLVPVKLVLGANHCVSSVGNYLFFHKTPASLGEFHAIQLTFRILYTDMFIDLGVVLPHFSLSAFSGPQEPH